MNTITKSKLLLSMNTSRKFISLVVVLCAFIIKDTQTWAQGNNNYVKTELMLDSVQNNKITSVTYYDGLGRPVLNATNGVGCNGNFVYELQKYDSFDRLVKKYQPAVGNTNLSMLGESAILAMGCSTYGDNSPFSENSYDALDRPVLERGAGEKWEKENAACKVEYLLNGERQVRLYEAPTDSITLIDKGYYKRGTLTGEKKTDESGQFITVYKDMKGHVVLERRGGNNDTYYVYNDLGQLRYVLPPEYQNSKKKAKYAYEYRYDERGRVVKKILPGNVCIQYWYDNADHITYMQDGNLKKKNLYRFMFYDRLGRLAVQGTCSACDRSNIGILRAELNTNPVYCIKNTGYAIFNLDNDFRLKDVEIVNYYDNYDYLATGIMRNNAMLQAKVQKNNDVCTNSLQTGSIVRASNGEWLCSVMYYDKKGRVVKTLATQLYGYLKETTTSYTFTDKVKSEKTVEFAPDGKETMGVEYTYEYNRYNDMLQSIDLKLSSENRAHRIVENTYDDLGRLISVKRSGSAGEVNYAYNIRNWVTDIKSDLFKESIDYNFNGNISSTQWQNGNGAVMGYRYNYDNLNRLVNSLYIEGTEKPENVNRFSESVGYNANGAITRLTRNGMKADGSYGLVDDLKIALDGNQLQNITDYADEINYKGASDFKDGAEGNTLEYWYNENGALIADANKGIARIDYDNCGCPRKIVFTNGNTTEYVYSSTGEKLRTTHKTAIDGITVALNSNDNLKDDDFLSEDKTDYHGSFIYENGKLDKVLYQGGYVEMLGGSLPMFHYYNQDHLGNNRSVVRENGYVQQITNYYPFGGVFSTNEAAYTKSPDAQSYKYNGKELDRTHGLDWYDYGARNYDATLPMWDRVDPLCEEFYHITPYAYCYNNPVNTVDPDGRIGIVGGALIGAGVELASQLIGNYDTNMSVIDNLSENVNWTNVAIAAGEGALTSGASAFKRTGAKLAVSAVSSTAKEVSSHMKKGGDINFKECGKNVVSSIAINYAAGKIAKVGTNFKFKGVKATPKNAVKHTRAGQKRYSKSAQKRANRNLRKQKEDYSDKVEVATAAFSNFIYSTIKRGYEEFKK